THFNPPTVVAPPARSAAQGQLAAEAPTGPLTAESVARQCRDAPAEDSFDAKQAGLQGLGVRTESVPPTLQAHLSPNGTASGANILSPPPPEPLTMGAAL
ncbi:hypothetical protein FRC07_011743, partial [Ceratobasidium sp. 392]